MSENWGQVAQQAFLIKTKKASSSIKRFTGHTARWRNLCLKRDKYLCVLCFSAENLEVHHIQRWVDAPILRLKKSNGVTLCRTCHAQSHGNCGSEFPPDVTRQLLDIVKFGRSKSPYMHEKRRLIKHGLGITMPIF